MNRRNFFGTCAGAALGAAAAQPAFAALPVSSLNPDSAAPPYSLSVMLWTIYRDLPFDQRLAKVAEAGYHAVELVGEFKDWTKQQFADARKKKNELGIQFDATAGIWHSIVDPATRDVYLKALQDFLVPMQELECTRLILQTGNKVSGLTQEQMHANCIETLKRSIDLTEKSNIEILIENIDPEENPKYFLTSSAEGFDIVRSVGHPRVKFLYDFFHEQIAEGNLIAKLAKNMDLLGLVHVADVPGRHEPGSGEIYYPNIFRKLAELGYSRYIAMEFMPLGDPIAALRAAREMANKFASLERKQSALEKEVRRPHAAA
jgi:hydroxypyruvate isomerase